MLTAILSSSRCILKIFYGFPEAFLPYNIFRKLLDTFEMCLDTFGSVRMRLDAFGFGRRRFKVIHTRDRRIVVEDSSDQVRQL